MTELNHRQDQEGPAELSLIDLIIVLLKYKRMILSFVIITVLGGLGLIYLWNQRSASRSVSEISLRPAGGIYYSECLIEPERGLLERINSLIYRRNFVFQMIQENHLEADIQKAIQSEEKETAAAGEAVPRPEIFRWVRGNLFATVSGNVLTLGFTAPQEDLPPKMISAFLKSLSDFSRRLDLDRIAAQQKDLRRNLAEARDPFLKARISEEIVKLLGNEAKVRNEKYYRFDLLDPP
ncbi:MAG: hypothetical protein L7F78_27705, partial [Syntrophales bacterium LBB04]|nr:hypothetical protein [Syntrophales bacterium LBB04]